MVALIEPAEGVTAPPAPPAAELLEHLRPPIARFKHPRRIEYRDGSAPTPTGKLSRSP